MNCMIQLFDAACDALRSGFRCTKYNETEVERKKKGGRDRLPYEAGEAS